MTTQGIVMDLFDDYAIVLTKDGQFTRVVRTEMMVIGAQCDGLMSAMPTTAPRHTRNRRKMWGRALTLGAAACVAVAVVATTQTRDHSVYAQPYAFVSLDINPSISFEVSQTYEVLSAVGLNSDGTHLLQHLSVKNLPLNIAVQDILQAAVKSSLLPADDSILVSVSPGVANADVVAVQKAATEDVQQAVVTTQSVAALNPKVYSVALSSAVWHAASSAHVSPGKLAAYLVARNEGMNLTMNQVDGKSMGRIFNSQTSVTSLFTAALQNENVQQVERQIEQMVTAGKLNPMVKTQPQSVVQHPVASGLNAGHPSPTPPGKDKGKANGKANEKAASVPTVKVTIGNSTFSINIGNGMVPSNDNQGDFADGQGTSHDKGNPSPKNDSPDGKGNKGDGGQAGDNHGDSHDDSHDNGKGHHDGQPNLGSVIGALFGGDNGGDNNH